MNRSLNERNWYGQKWKRRKEWTNVRREGRKNEGRVEGNNEGREGRKEGGEHTIKIPKDDKITRRLTRNKENWRLEVKNRKIQGKEKKGRLYMRKAMSINHLWVGWFVLFLFYFLFFLKETMFGDELMWSPLDVLKTQAKTFLCLKKLKTRCFVFTRNTNQWWNTYRLNDNTNEFSL